MSGLWESSTGLLVQLPVIDSPVLAVSTLILALVVTVLNTVLWLTATILQIVLLLKIDNKRPPYTILCLAVSWSIINLIVSAGSVYGLLRNTVKDVKGYLTLHACVGVLALIIFIFHVITLNSESATEDWLGPGGFTIFTGLYIAGVTCIIVPYLYSHLKNFQAEAEEKRMDMLRQHFNQQKDKQLRTLSRVGHPTPPATERTKYMENVTSSNASLYPVDIEQVDVSSTISSSYTRSSSMRDALNGGFEEEEEQEEEDRLTYSFPPTFV